MTLPDPIASSAMKAGCSAMPSPCAAASVNASPLFACSRARIGKFIGVPATSNVQACCAPTMV